MLQLDELWEFAKGGVRRDEGDEEEEEEEVWRRDGVALCSAAAY